MRLFSILLFLLLNASNLSSQITPWEVYHSATSLSSQSEPYGQLIEKDNSILSLAGRTFKEYSHSGELIHSFVLLDTTSGPFNHYFFMDEITRVGQEFLLMAQRGGATGNMILSVYTKNGQLISGPLILEDSIVYQEIKGPAGIKEKEANYLFFGEEWIYQVTLSEKNELKIKSKKTNTGDAVAAVISTSCGGFLTCSTLGVLNKYDLTLNLEWSQSLLFAATDLIESKGGYVICGYIEDDAILRKINFKGKLEWEQHYEEFKPFAITVTSDEALLIGGMAEHYFFNKLIKTNDKGTIIWEKRKTLYPCINLIASKYGGIWKQTKRSQIGISYLNDLGDLEDFDDKDFRPELKINNINTTTSASGSLFNGEDYSYGYRFPKDSLTRTMFSIDLWIAGYDQNDELHASRARRDNNGSFTSGSIGNIDSAFWNYVWVLDKEMIHHTVTDLKDGKQDYPIPYDLLYWPAKGNPNIYFHGRYINIMEDMAPFEDVNNDGIYNIYDGDFPTLKGDQMLWWVFNDDIDDEDALPLGVEVQGSLFAFECNDNLINNASFIEFDIQNKSSFDYQNLKVGLNTVNQVGCANDDYFGSLPDVNSYFAYNKDEVDGTSICWPDENRFYNDIPIQSVTFLNHRLNNFIYYNDPWCTVPPGPWGPGGLNTTYQLMESIWKDNDVHMTVGGNGYNPSSIEFTNFVFPDNPSDTSGWSSCTADVLGLAGYGDNLAASEVFALPPNQNLKLHYGMLTHSGVNDLPCPDISHVKDRILLLQEHYDRYLSTDYIDGEVLDLGPDMILENNTPVYLSTRIDKGIFEWSTSETTPIVQVDQPGIYTVEYVSPLGCTQSDTIRILASQATEKLKAPFVFPNPATGCVFIEWEKDVPTEIHLKNIIGHQIQSYDLNTELENSRMPIHLSNLGNGVYLLVFEYKNGATNTRKIIYSGE